MNRTITTDLIEENIPEEGSLRPKRFCDCN